LPKPPYHPANRKEAIDMDFESEIIFMATFMTCHKVPLGGLVEVEIQKGLVWTSNTC
jgi:hypothetical protein